VAVDEARLARVHARYSGWVEQLLVATTGQKVRRGQVLAALYNLELVPAQQEFLAARRWSKPGATGESTLAPSGESLEEDARARLELFGLSRGEIEVIAKTGKPARAIAVSAPIDGYVVRKSAVRGSYVQPGTELFEIADLSKVWVVAEIYEYDMARVRVGQTVDVALSAYPGQRFSGKVAFIQPTVDAATRTSSVRVELPNKDGKLRPGMYGDVTIRLDGAEGVVVPAEALVDTGEYQYVFLAREGGRFEPRRVRAGARSGGKVQILEGLAPGDSVVTTANFLIDSESRLRAAIERPPAQ
jgi:Cu(I)/Ag(I) efflux system membrane fusion protein